MDHSMVNPRNVNDNMTNERIVTFHCTPFLTTQCTSISNSPSKLAEAGWERTPESVGTDEVVCRACGACFSGWEGESPIAVHRIISPNCPILKDFPVGATTSDGRPLKASYVKRQLFPAPPPESRTGAATADGSAPLPVPSSLLKMVVGHPFVPFGGFDMQFVGIRLMTYTVQKLPVDTYRHWAEKGFAFNPDPRELQCVYCGVAADGNHQPDQVHQDKAPHCPFFNKVDVGNIGIEEENRIRKKYHAQIGQADYNEMAGLGLSLSVKFNVYEDEEKRIESFKKQGWPSLLADKFTPERMSSVGLFYTGLADTVWCFFCGVGLKKWTAGADPLAQHARWSPSCQFLKDTLGSEAVTRASNAEALTEAVYPGQKTGQSNVILTMEGVSSDMMDFEAVEAARKANFSFEQICRALLHFLQCTKKYPLTETLLAALKVHNELTADIVNKEQEKAQAVQEKAQAVQEKVQAVAQAVQEKAQAVQEKAQAVQEKAQAVAQAVQEKAQAVQEKEAEKQQVIQEKENTIQEQANFIQKLAWKLSIFQAGSSPSSHGAANSIEEDAADQEFAEAYLCKFCCDAKADVAFIPCGHFLSCNHCVSRLTDPGFCPFCREMVIGIQRIYAI